VILSSEELFELTKKQRFKAQARVLSQLGIPYRERPDGSLVVYRTSLNAPQKVTWEPDYSVLGKLCR